MTKRPTDNELADWLLATLKLYGCEGATAYKVVGLFLEGLNYEAIALGQTPA